MDKYRGSFSKIIFHNESNGYTVAIFETDEEYFTAVGTLYNIAEGDNYIISGTFIQNKQYGEQFKFDEIEECLPTTVDEIERFLASGIIKGIGAKKAKDIVKMFAERSLEVIENIPEALIQIPGIGEKTAISISESYREKRVIKNLVVFLQNYGIEARYAGRIYDIYEEDAEKIIAENPYQLMRDIASFGFKKADSIAMKLGIERDSSFRVKSAIEYILSKSFNEGHCYVLEEELILQTIDLIEADREAIDDAILDLIVEGIIFVDKINNQRCVYLSYVFDAEVRISKSLWQINNIAIKPLGYKIENLIKQIEVNGSISYSQEQKNAIMHTLQNKVSVITGGPGTGKTTILKAILDILDIEEVPYDIAAPTGRAAKRIAETTGRQAVTIHRLLNYHRSMDDGKMHFGKNENEQLESDVIIVDEASMIDIILMDALLKAIPIEARLIMVGDVEQLPPVSAGNILMDIIESETVNVQKLTEIFRQASESNIVVNAHRINNGEMPTKNVVDGNFFFMEKTSDSITSTIIDLCNKRLPQHYGLESPLTDIQILSPMKKRTAGTIELNQRLQEILNPTEEYKAEKKIGSKVYREGDKIIQTRNNYSITWIDINTLESGDGVFNGEIGFVDGFDEDGNMIVIFDESRRVIFSDVDLDDLELAYAITVHKAQGSEFNVVIIALKKGIPDILANRNLLYTAVTRGKNLVVVVGDRQQLEVMIKNKNMVKRNSALAIRLKRFIENTN